jgi:hypothetical protein
MLDISYGKLKQYGKLKDIISQIALCRKDISSINLMYNRITDQEFIPLIQWIIKQECGVEQSILLKQRLSKMYLHLACNRITEVGLKLAHESELFSAASMLSLISSNSIFDKDYIEIVRLAAIKRLDQDEQSR